MSEAARSAELLTHGMTRWSIPLPDPRPNPSLVSALAQAFILGGSTEEGVVARAAETLGRDWRWLRPVAKRYLAAFGDRVPPRHRQAAEFLKRDASFLRACRQRDLTVAHRIATPPEMRPAKWAQSLGLPRLLSVGALAQWLRLTPSEVAWFADLKGLLSKKCDARLQHYTYRAIAKRSGGLRIVEAPKQHLKHIQRQILAEILNEIPTHPGVHGFVQGRSIKSFAAQHVGQRVLLRMDIEEFFPSFSRARIQALFRMCGYPENVADLLGGLCTTRTPRSVWAEHTQEFDLQRLTAARYRHETLHLPQGAPTSPALANVCFYRIDCRLDGLAKSAGATYTRYADDLAFSGGAEFEQAAERFAVSVASILLEYGFVANPHKTRIMRRGGRQALAGIVVNDRINIARRDFDRLKAILTNCVRNGVESENREGHADFRAHLNGRVAFVESMNAQKGARLRRIFEQIEWRS